MTVIKIRKTKALWLAAGIDDRIFPSSFSFSFLFCALFFPHGMVCASSHDRELSADLFKTLTVQLVEA